MRSRQIQAGLSPREALTVKRIVKVNHAGEHGAIRIYRAQIRVARRLYPDIVADLSQMLAHEVEHCAIFRDAMPARGSRSCRTMGLWGLGGSLLGFTTALMGRQAIWVCTAAVEAAVHRHLDDQLHFLAARDGELHASISAIREEEMSHLHHAEQQLHPPNLPQRALRGTVTVLTDVVIWLSTWGDSTRMAADLRRALKA